MSLLTVKHFFLCHFETLMIHQKNVPQLITFIILVTSQLDIRSTFSGEIQYSVDYYLYLNYHTFLCMLCKYNWQVWLSHESYFGETQSFQNTYERQIEHDMLLKDTNICMIRHLSYPNSAKWAWYQCHIRSVSQYINYSLHLQQKYARGY